MSFITEIKIYFYRRPYEKQLPSESALSLKI